MATPKLKINAAPSAPRRSLVSSGTAPASRVKLKGSDGKAIQPKAKSAAPAAETPTPKAEEAAVKAAAEAETKAAAEAQAAAEAANAAEEEAARKAQEEYERQMEEYNRQMEEYNRQMAEYQAAQAAAEAEAATPENAAVTEQSAAETVEAAQELTEEAPTPAAKIKSSKPAGKTGALVSGKTKPSGTPAPKKKKKAAPKLTPEEEAAEAEAAARDAYLAELERQANATPVWKKLPFIVGVGVLVLAAGCCTWYVLNENAKQERVQQHRDYIKSVLLRAQDINQKGVDTLADAKAKGVDVTCSRKDAKALMEVIVDPFVKSETGSNLYGPDPIKTVGYTSCLLLGLAAESDAEICKYIFDIVSKKCDKIDSGLFRWLLQRIAVAGNNEVNVHLRKLAEAVNAKPNWATKTKALAAVWECIGLRIGKNDVPELISILSDEKTDKQLANTLSICLDNVLRMMDDSEKAEKVSIGNQIFDGLSEKLRGDCCTIMAKACSDKALAHYKSELSDLSGWNNTNLTFISYWGDDDILDYVLELQQKAKGSADHEADIKLVISTIFRQNRERSDADAEKILKLFCEQPFADTSKVQDLINKSDPDSSLFIGEGPELEKIKAERETLEKSRKDKLSIIKNLASLRDFKWVTNLLERYGKDADSDVALAAKQAMEQVQKNTAAEMEARETYKSRNQ